MSSDPDFEVIGELSDQAIEALAALLLSVADEKRCKEHEIVSDRPITDSDPQQQLGRIA
jgi:hypothetical protein